MIGASGRGKDDGSEWGDGRSSGRVTDGGEEWEA